MTTPRPGRMHVDAVDGFGGWSVELQAALPIHEAAVKEKCTTSGQALRGR